MKSRPCVRPRRSLPGLGLAAGMAALAGSVVLGAGCVGEEPAPGPPYRVVVLDQIGPPIAGNRTAFALQHRTLETVTTFARLESPSFRVRQGGTVTAELSAAGDGTTTGRFEGGVDPDLRYTIDDGVAVPRDNATLSMFSAAYQFEHILPRLIAASSTDVADAYAAHGVMDVFFGPQIVAETEGIRTSVRVRTNAFFNPVGWQFGIQRFSGGERVPLGIDSLVLSHELGHSVFQVEFFGGSMERCDPAQADAHATDPWFPNRLEDELAISGLNEGFADWISFAVTGGTDPLDIVNFPPGDAVDERAARSMTVDNFRWSQVGKLEGAPADLGCSGKYCLGTLFARSLVATYLAGGNAMEDEAARQTFSRMVVAAVHGARERMQGIGLPLPTADVAHCKVRADVSSALDPPVIGAFLAAFLAGVPADLTAHLCNELSGRFEDGFPVTFRRGCTP
jgi:hypothetical protein